MEEERTEEHKPEESSQFDKKLNTTEKIRQNPWMLSTFVLGVLIIILLIGNFSGGITGSTVNEGEAVDSVLTFVNSQIDGEAELVEVNFDGILYEVVVLVDGAEVPIYLTADGKNLVQGVIPLSLLVQEEEEEKEEIDAEISKSDKPVVELFIMSFCPYGTQAEKGFIPAIEALGDTIDAKIRFVYYAMHPSYGEVEEQLNQHCIQEEQNEKYLDYLECFLEEGDSEACLTEAKIDVNKMKSCAEKTDKEFDILKNLNDQSLWLNGRFPLFNIHKDLNEAYGIGGSPTLVINGQVVSSGRDSASYLDVICQAFNEAPSECGLELSDMTYSPGFGYEEGQDTGAQC